MVRLFTSTNAGIREKLKLINWGLVAIVTILCFIGVAMQYSAGGNNFKPWAIPQLVRFLFGFCLMIAFAVIDVRFWLRFAYPIYALMLILLLAVDIMGHVGMGAQRWINLGFFVLQPSELMKIALILALAKYFHGVDIEDIGRPLLLLPPVIMILVPAALVLAQPNLGTAIILVLVGASLFFVAGVRWWKFAIVIATVILVAPFAWNHLHDYQKARLTTFINPGADPLGSGYNIIQSKIALGSGGLFGRGFGKGTQSQLQFLPEKHTDFIFVVLAEEMGMIGAMIIMFLFFLLLAYGLSIAISCKNQFSRLVAFGISFCFFIHVFINIAMVTGTIPVVGIPLPLISYGGTSLITLLMACGILLGVSVHRDVRISRTGNIDF